MSLADRAPATALRPNVSVVAWVTVGDMKDTLDVLAPERVTAGPLICDHVYRGFDRPPVNVAEPVNTTLAS